MQVQRGVRVLAGTDLRQLLTLNDVVPAVESAYLATAGQRAVMYPVIREPLPESSGVFGIKSGYWPDRGSIGLKVAGYWPRNRARGLENHQAMVVLVDPGTGVPQGFLVLAGRAEQGQAEVRAGEEDFGVLAGQALIGHDDGAGGGAVGGLAVQHLAGFLAFAEELGVSQGEPSQLQISSSLLPQYQRE